MKKFPPTILLRILKKMKEKLKNEPVLQQAFKEHNIDIKELEFYPMYFKDLDVSAKCDHGIIYFNYKLLSDDFEKNYSYAIHELTHTLQQLGGTHPTQSSSEGDYLENKYEQEGFQNQIKYIAKEEGEDEAEDYVENLLDHHEVDSNTEREETKETLMAKV